MHHCIHPISQLSTNSTSVFVALSISQISWRCSGNVQMCQKGWCSTVPLHLRKEMNLVTWIQVVPTPTLLLPYQVAPQRIFRHTVNKLIQQLIPRKHHLIPRNRRTNQVIGDQEVATSIIITIMERSIIITIIMVKRRSIVEFMSKKLQRVLHRCQPQWH